jgi:hypothetical protein
MLEQTKMLYEAALNDLSQVNRNTLPREYQDILDAIKQRREMEAEAQALLDEHVRRHGC